MVLGGFVISLMGTLGLFSKRATWSGGACPSRGAPRCSDGTRAARAHSSLEPRMFVMYGAASVRLSPLSTGWGAS